MAFEIVAFDFPDAFAAAPKLYAEGFTSFRFHTCETFTLSPLDRDKHRSMDQNQVQDYLVFSSGGAPCR